MIKVILLTAITTLTVGGSALRYYIMPAVAFNPNHSQEWVMTVNHPSCSSVSNVQVIWPKDSNDPILIECDK